VASIDEISSNGLTQRVEMPEQLLERITAIVRARSHSQLEVLREKLRATSGAVARGIPLDMHTRPLGWTLDKSQQIKPFAYGPQETLAYLAFDVEDAFACTHNVLSELKRRLPTFAPRSMLDFGAGPGTAPWAARGLFDDSLSSYRVVEPSQSMVDAATSILDGFPGLSVRRSIADMAREIGATDDKADGARYDLITANFVLSDLTSDFERVAVTSALWELLDDGGCLVIVDHGNPWGSHQVRSARQFVLDTINEQEGDGDEDDDEEGEKAASETRDSVRIVAPCPHQHEVRQAYLCTVASWIPVG
jgi:ribosomal protein RSM22 (predicted rRNA methylase)